MVWLAKEGLNFMSVWVYAICKDEKKIVGYFLRHYCTFCDKIIIYDGGSTDGTREEIAACPKAELRNWPGSEGIVDDEFMAFANEQWREAIGKTEWVAWVDLDEFLYCPNITQVLQRYLETGVNIPQIGGYTMVSRHFPTTDGQIYDEIKTGFPDGVWDKKAIFRENMIWNVGRHSINHPALRIVSSEYPEIKLLHYRALGADYVRWRHARNWARVPERCRALNLGTNTAPDAVGHHTIGWFEEVISKDWPEVI